MKEPRVLTTLQSRLTKAASKHGVPGAAMAVLRGRAFYEAATGVLNVNTGVEATTDSIFQIGSITKTFTGTLALQLVDQRRLRLDEPIRSYLSDFAVADPEVSRKITVRHLLTHTSGIEGDFFIDAGRGEDRLARFVDKCALLPQLHPLGTYWSYCNSGFTILGRVLEVVSGRTWDELMHERIFAPLGMTRSTTLPEETVVFRTAVGHMPDPKRDGQPTVTPMPYLQPSAAPAGSSTAMTAADLVRFARMHLGGGVAPNGTRILSSRSVAAMQERQFDFGAAGGSRSSAMGLSWLLWDWNGARLFGHDGGTIGQYAFLRILPKPKIAVVLLTNGGNAQALFDELYGAVFGALAGVKPPKPPKPGRSVEIDLDRYAGVYENLGSRVEVSVLDDRLAAKIISKVFRDVVPPMTLSLVAVDETSFVAIDADGTPIGIVPFREFDQEGRPRYIEWGRLARRTIR